jgi:hypothetical protein
MFLMIEFIFAISLWLFWDPVMIYRLHSDDFAYIGASRTLRRAVAVLFVPHNTHIVPAWRLLTWAVVASAGGLAKLPSVLAAVSFGTLALTMVLVGHFALRETGRASVGLAAMVGMGTTSILKHAATWYSAGQTLWAAIGILLMLIQLQGWRRSGGAWRLGLAAAGTWLAGGFWTVGHAAGPVGAVYLWADGRRRCRKAAAVPLLATALAVVLALVLGGRRINARISFHGRTSQEAVDPLMGMAHTLQAIPEDLVLGNLGLVSETTLSQGIGLSLALAAAWAWSRRGRLGETSRAAGILIGVAFVVAIVALPILVARPKLHRGFDLLAYPAFVALGGIVLSGRGTPLERAGAALVLIAYFVEWSFRGYLPFSSLRGVVPWYDAIPQVGAMLFAVGWCAGAKVPPIPGTRVEPVSRRQAVGILVFAVAMWIAHQPRVNALFIEGVPKMTEEEARALPTRDLQRHRAVYLAVEIARWQRRHLARLDRAQAVARRLGIGREGIARTFGRVDMPELPKVYDAAPMLDLPWRGTENDPAVIRQALGPYFAMEPEPTLPLNRLRH